MVTQLAVLAADQLQPLAAITVAAPVPPLAGKEMFAGETL
jgi:hypothetical protein